jgi:broad specificity phosphatase PhoE
VRFDAAYCSTLSRSSATAALLLEGTGCRATPLPALDELSYGALQGLTPEARAEHHATLDRQWRSTPWEVAFPHGETLADVHARAIPAWDGIVARHAGETVLIVAHGHVNRVLLLRASSLPPGAFWHLEQPNASCWVVRGGLATELSHADAFVGPA